MIVKVKAEGNIMGIRITKKSITIELDFVLESV